VMWFSAADVRGKIDLSLTGLLSSHDRCVEQSQRNVGQHVLSIAEVADTLVSCMVEWGHLGCNILIKRIRNC